MATKKPTKQKQPTEKSTKLGVEALAKEMNVSVTYTRVLLRKNEIPREGRAYEFTPTELKRVAKQLQSSLAA